MNLVFLVPPVFVVLWSTGWVVAKYAAFHASPLLFLTMRFGFAAMVFAAICLFSGAARLRSRTDVLHAILSGVFLQGIYLGGVWWAIAQGVPAGLSGIISALQPLMTAFAAPFLIGERLTGRQKLGIGLGFAGIMIAIAPNILATDASRLAFLPLAVNLVAMMGVTYGTIYQKKHLQSGDIRVIALLQYVGAFLFIGAIAVLFETPHFDGTWEAWGALGWSVLGLSAGAIGLLLYLLRHGQVSQAASLNYLVPPMVALQAWLMFGEKLSGPMIAGAIVAAAGVYLTRRRRSSAAH